MRIRSLRTAFTAAVSLSATLFAPASLAQGLHGLTRYDGDKVVEIRIDTQDAYDLAMKISGDPWSHRVKVGQAASFRIPANRLAELEASGLDFRVVLDDLQARVDAERIRERGEGFFDSYKRLEEHSAFLDDLRDQRPDLVTRISAGTSLQGRDIFGIRVTGPGPDSHERPSIVFNGAQHAREWVAPMTVSYIAERLVQGYGSDPRITQLLDSAQVYLVPVINPDGYVYTWDVDRFWRKNRRNNGGSTGVDLNRNWSVGWGLNSGSSGVGSSETYRGVAPFSEPETASVRDWLLSLHDLRAHIDYHSFSEVILGAWAHTDDPSPDRPLLESLGQEMSDAIAEVHGVRYPYGFGSQLLYLASGTMPDWMYGELDALSWTIELRPATSAAGGFTLPASQIIPCAEENLPGALTIAEWGLREIALTAPPTPAHAQPASPVEVSFGMRPLPGRAIDQSSVRIVVQTDGGAVEVPAAPAGNAMYIASLDPRSCGDTIELEIRASTASGASVRYPADESELFTIDIAEEAVAFDDDFETDNGWTVGAPGDTATTGIWVRAVPVASGYQPGADSTPGGSFCFVTGNASPGAGDGVNDIDDGRTSLTSPTLDASLPGDPHLHYARWVGISVPGGDYFELRLSNDNGASWTLVERVETDARAWVRRTVRIADYLEPTHQMRVRVAASDGGTPSLVEAAIDDVRISATGCFSIEGDTNGDGRVDFADLNAVLNDFGSTGAALPGDANGDGAVNFSDLNLVLNNFGAGG